MFLTSSLSCSFLLIFLYKWNSPDPAPAELEITHVKVFPPSYQKEICFRLHLPMILWLNSGALFMSLRTHVSKTTVAQNKLLTFPSCGSLEYSLVCQGSPSSWIISNMPGSWLSCLASMHGICPTCPVSSSWHLSRTWSSSLPCRCPHPPPPPSCLWVEGLICPRSSSF